MSEGGGHLSRETLIAIIILLFYTVSAPLFKKYHFHYMHESGICMLVGVLISMIAQIFSPNVSIIITLKQNFTQSLKFDDEMFFTFILPPMIFSGIFLFKV